MPDDGPGQQTAGSLERTDSTILLAEQSNAYVVASENQATTNHIRFTASARVIRLRNEVNQRLPQDYARRPRKLLSWLSPTNLLRETKPKRKAVMNNWSFDDTQPR